MQKTTKPLSFLDLGNKYVDWYLVGAFTETMIRDYAVIRECLYECYKYLTNSFHLLQIELMEEQSKSELWNECKKYCEPLSENDRIKFVKAYAALAYLMQKRL